MAALNISFIHISAFTLFILYLNYANSAPMSDVRGESFQLEGPSEDFRLGFVKSAPLLVGARGSRQNVDFDDDDYDNLDARRNPIRKTEGKIRPIYVVPYEGSVNIAKKNNKELTKDESSTTWSQDDEQSTTEFEKIEETTLSSTSTDEI